MGWKAFKEKFGIKHHVQANDSKIFIGSSYVFDIVEVDKRTGRLKEGEIAKGFLNEFYPRLLIAKAEEILDVINEPDVFATSIRVFTFEGGDVVEKRCEVLGWPNNTHDGCMMYENRYSADRQQVIQWAKDETEAAIGFCRDSIKATEIELAKLKKRLNGYQADLEKLTAAASVMN